MKIYLFCESFPTTLLAIKMQEAADSKGRTCHVKTFRAYDIEIMGSEADVILIGSQFKSILNSTKERLPNKPIAVIPMKDYGLIAGEAVLNMALKLYEEHQNQ